VYDQLSRALHSKGAVCPFPATFPQSIVRHLNPLGLIFTLGIRNAAGEIVAAGLFPHDNGTVYLWECSSELKGRDLHPNELLFWGLMCRAAEHGISVYDMSGYGRFNNGFGGQLVAVHRWNKCYSLAARSAREVFEKILKLNRRDTFLSRLLSPVVR
jgi:CelD/BcsL family acetyltransferase involved in cellulose biosynthesis